MQKTYLLVFAVIILFSVFTNFYHLESRHSFDYDQETFAKISYSQIIKGTTIGDKVTLIGPQTVSNRGFFVGPLYYYFLAPFLAATGGDPVGGSVFAGIIGVLTTVLAIFVGVKIFGYRVAAIFGTLSALSPNMTNWNFMLMLPITLVAFYANWLVIKGKTRYILLSAACVGLALNSHVSFVFILINMIAAIALAPKRNWRMILASGGIIFLFLSPLILFDLTHNFLNIRNVLSFSSDNTGMHVYETILVFLRSIWGIILPLSKIYLSAVFYLLLAGIGIAFAVRDKRYVIFVLINIFVPLLCLLFYKGVVSEYYFTTSSMVIMLFVAVATTYILRSDLLNIVFASVLMIAYAYTLWGARGEHFNQHDKKSAVKQIVAEAKGKPFEFYADVSYGRHYGFGYLFKIYGAEPRIDPKVPMYVLSEKDPDEKPDHTFIKTFGDYYLYRSR